MEDTSQDSTNGGSIAMDHTFQESSNGGGDNSIAIDHTSQASNGGWDDSPAVGHTYSQANNGDSFAVDHASHTSQAINGGWHDSLAMDHILEAINRIATVHTSQTVNGGWDEDSVAMDYTTTSQASYGGGLDDSFQQIYRCYPLSQIHKSHLETGDKIIMPSSALDRLLSLRIDYPMLFEIENISTSRVSHCGVLEFSGEEGMVFLPNWMMNNMKLHDGDDVEVKNTTLPKGTFMKLQPHLMDFVHISDPKALLEVALRNFSCLTTGDTVMITHNGKKFYIDVVETKPSSAICIVETDCEVDFAPPLDYKEPEKPKPAVLFTQKNNVPTKVVKEPAKEEPPKFKPFTGAARRLDGEPVTELAAPVLKEDQLIENDRTSRAAGKVVSKNPRKLSKEDVKTESLKEEQKFQPFTGKKYTLG